MSSSTSSIIPLLDLETSPIIGQQSFAILDLNGNVVRRSSNSSGQQSSSSLESTANNTKLLLLSDNDILILFQMFLEIGNLSSFQKEEKIDNNNADASSGDGGGGFRRFTVTFPSTPSVRYIVSRDQGHVYIVQTKTV